MPFRFDFDLLRKYWVERPAVYHHTMPILQYYALYEALRLALDEGLETRWERHADAGAHLQAELRGRGFDLLADPDYQLPQLTAVACPRASTATRSRPACWPSTGSRWAAGSDPPLPRSGGSD